MKLPAPSQGHPALDTAQEPSNSKGSRETVADTGPVPVVPVLRWEPHKAITNARELDYYVVIVRSIKRHLVAESNTDIQETEKEYKGALLEVEQVVPTGEVPWQRLAGPL